MSLKEKIRRLQEDGVSLAKIAGSCGYTGSVLTEWLKGTYKGNVTKLEVALSAFVGNYYKRKRQKDVNIVFCDTVNARKVFSLCQIAHLDKKICVVVSESGLGKTAALHEYAGRNPGTIMIDVDPTYNPKRLFKVLHASLGRNAHGLLEDIYADCTEALKASDRLLIIDEAELLNHKAIELLRRLHDKSGVGMVLSGMPRLIENIRGVRSEFPQVYTRVGGSMRLGSLTQDDTAMIVQSYITEANGSVDTFHKLSKQNGRHLSMLIFQAIRIAEKNAVPVSEDIIRKAASTIEV